MFEKWKRAVVHLECATDSEHFYDRFKRMREQKELRKQGKITDQQFGLEMMGGMMDVRFHGTALFLSHADRRYLLTARHVVRDELSAEREVKEAAQRALDWPEHMRHQLLQGAIEQAQNRIFNNIFRVPRIDEVQARREDPEYLMNLGAGASWIAPYTFSDPDHDLAVISLDQRNSRFAEELISRGYTPIESNDIADGPDVEGREVITIGFPGSIPLLDQVSQDVAYPASPYFSLPVTTFGRVSMLHNTLPFFWADMSIYPGNSGGPVVANDRLVGVVSAQATIPIDNLPEEMRDVRMRIPFGKIIKAEFARGLIEEQVEKDRRML